MKKTASILFSFVLAISSVLFCESLIYADTAPCVYIEYDEVVSAGEALRLPIRINNNSGLMGFRIDLSYDGDALTPTSVEYGDVLDGGLQDNIEGDAVAGAFKVYWSGSENNTENGILFYVSFNVASTASGSTTLKLSYSQEDTFDENYDDVILDCQDFEINIVNNNYSSYAKVTASADDAAVGDGCSVALKLSELKALEAMQLTLTYPTDVFEFVSAESTANITAENNNGNVVFDINGITSAMNNIEFITAKFKCKEQAAQGEYAIGLSSATEGVFCKGCAVKVNSSVSSEAAVIYTNEITAKNNDIIDVPVTIGNNRGIMGYMLHFEYNPAELEIVLVTSGASFIGNFENNIGDNGGRFDVLWTGSDAIAENGTLLTLKLKVITDKELSSIIKITYSQDDTFNEEYKDVVLDCRDITLKLNPSQSEPETETTMPVNNGPSTQTEAETETKAAEPAATAPAEASAPKATKITKARALKKAVKLKWKSRAKQATGYQLQYATNKKFKKKKTVNIKNSKKTAKTIKKLKSNKRYYVRIRTYKIVNGKKYYSKWSKVKSVKTK